MRNQYKILEEKYSQVQEGLSSFLTRGNTRKIINFLKQKGFDIDADPINNSFDAFKDDIEILYHRDSKTDMLFLRYPDETGIGPLGTEIVTKVSTLLEPELQQLFDKIDNIIAGAHGFSPNSKMYQIKKDVRSRALKAMQEPETLEEPGSEEEDYDTDKADLKALLDYLNKNKPDKNR